MADFWSNQGKRLGKIITEIESVINDANHWNGLHSEYPPIDVERDRVALHAARKALAAIEQRDSIRSEVEIKKMVEYLTEIGK